MIFTRTSPTHKIRHSFYAYGDTCLDLSTVAAVTVAEFGSAVLFQDGHQLEVNEKDARLIAEALLATFPELDGEYGDDQVWWL